jgi:hypothetical protein
MMNDGTIASFTFTHARSLEHSHLVQRVVLMYKNPMVGTMVFLVYLKFRSSGSLHHHVVEWSHQLQFQIGVR